MFVWGVILLVLLVLQISHSRAACRYCYLLRIVVAQQLTSDVGMLMQANISKVMVKMSSEVFRIIAAR